jgi:quinol monooxygenase YgiN
MSQPEPPGDDPDGVDLTVVTMRFETSQPEALAAVLAKYVVLSRGHDGCRNIDLCGSVTRPGRFLVIEKWASAAARQAHFDSPTMVEMAEACRSLLTGPPDLDLFEAISAHDLR